jgi:hypothetical protein
MKRDTLHAIANIPPKAAQTVSPDANNQPRIRRKPFHPCHEASNTYPHFVDPISVSLHHQSAPGEPQAYLRPPCQAVQKSRQLRLCKVKQNESRSEERDEKRRYETHCFWAICRLNTASIEEETDRSGSLALPLAESIHQLLKSSSPLDFEEDLVVVIGDFDVEMFTLTGPFRFLGRTWASVFVRARHVAVK